MVFLSKPIIYFRLLILLVFSFLGIQSCFAIHQSITDCDTLYHVNGDVILIRLYKHDSIKILYKLCNEYNRPVRKMNAPFIKKVVISETNQVIDYNNTYDLKSSPKMFVRKRSYAEKLSLKNGFALVGGFLLGSLLYELVFIFIPPNIRLLISSILIVPLILIFTIKDKAIKWLSILSIAFSILLGSFIISLLLYYL